MDDTTAISDGGHSIVNEPADTSRDKFILVRRDEIEPNPYQYREDWGDLPGLAKSIERSGVITALIGRPNPGTRGRPYQLAAGERRLRAAALAGLTHVPMIVRPMGDDEMIEILFQENLNRKDTTPLEEARGFKAALDRAYSVEQLMVKTGRSRGHIYGRLKLLELAAGAMKALQAGELPVAHAELIARIADRDAQDRCTKEVLGKIDNEVRDDLARLGIEHESLAKADATSEDLSGFPPRAPQLLSFRATKDLIRRRYMTRLAIAKFDPNDATLLPSTGACTPCGHRAGNQPALPGLVEAGKGDDYCTKPSCFESKTNAEFKRVANAAAQRGVKVLAGADETRRVFGYNATDVAGGSPYIDPSAKMPADLAKAGASQSWAKALGKRAADVPRVLVQDGTGAPRELLDREAAVDVLRELGKIDKPTKPPGKDKPKKLSLEEEARAKEKKEQPLKEEAFKRVLGQIADCAATDAKLDAGAGELALWKWLAFAITSTGTRDSDAWAMVAERRGLKLKQGERWIEWESLQKYIRDSKSVRELRGLVVELLVSTLDISESGLSIGVTGAAEQAFKSALKLFDADWTEAMSWAKAAAKAEARAAELDKAQKKVDAGVKKIKAKAKTAKKPAEPTPATKPCNAVAVYDDEWVCTRESGHDGRHMSEVSPGGTTAMWAVDKDGRERGKVFPISLQGKTLKQSGGWSTPVEPEKKLDKGLAAIAKKEKKPRGKAVKLRPFGCTAIHDVYGQCLRESGHTGDHQVQTEQKSTLFFSGKPTTCGAYPEMNGESNQGCTLRRDHTGTHENGRVTWKTGGTPTKKKGGSK